VGQGTDHASKDHPTHPKVKPRSTAANPHACTCREPQRIGGLLELVKAALERGATKQAQAGIGGPHRLDHAGPLQIEVVGGRLGGWGGDEGVVWGVCGGCHRPDLV